MIWSIESTLTRSWRPGRSVPSSATNGLTKMLQGFLFGAVRSIRNGTGAFRKKGGSHLLRWNAYSTGKASRETPIAGFGEWYSRRSTPSVELGRRRDTTNSARSRNP